MTFDAVMASLDYPMFVVTVAAGGEQAGCLVGFASQVSIDPPRFLVGLSEVNRTFEIARTADHLVVHVLDRQHRDLAVLFGHESGDEVDKFARCAWRAGPFGLPVLDDAVGWFCGEILERIVLGDHTGFLLAPGESWQSARAGDLLTFADVRDLAPGHPA